MGVEEEPTDPAICICSGCRRQAEIEHALRKTGARFETIYNPRAEPPYIVTVHVADRFHATGRGGEEGEALYHALHDLGLVS